MASGTAICDVSSLVRDRSVRHRELRAAGPPRSRRRFVPLASAQPREAICTPRFAAHAVVDEEETSGICSGQVKTATKLSRLSDFFVCIRADIPQVRMFAPTVVAHLDIIDAVSTGCLTRPSSTVWTCARASRCRHTALRPHCLGTPPCHSCCTSSRAQPDAPGRHDWHTASPDHSGASGQPLADDGLAPAPRHRAPLVSNTGPTAPHSLIRSPSLLFHGGGGKLSVVSL
jgi:hypothetical protein